MSDELKPKKGVKYIEEILKEVSNETDFSMDDVTQVWKIHKQHLETLMDDPETTAIKLPHLGTLYFNTYIADAVIKRTKDKDSVKELSEKSKLTKSIIKDHIEECEEKNYVTKFKYPQKRKAGIYKLFKNINTNVLKKKISTSYASFKRIMRIFEQYSNDELKPEDEQDI
jgi:DNA-binding MarR family transcriptional regulator